MTKYLTLFEDFSKEDNKASFAPSWSDLRDTVQSRLPFAIIIFLNRESYLLTKSTMLAKYNCIYQKAFLSKNGQLVAYPSVFIKLDESQPFIESIPKLYEKHKIKAMVVGKQGGEYVSYYFKNGSSAVIGNEILTSIDKDDMKNEDHFQLGSNLYRFVDFVG